MVKLLLKSKILHAIEGDMSQITVMTMNLRFGLALDGENGWTHRKHLVDKILKKYPGDFIGIQEANHFQTEFLIKSLSDHQFIGWHNKSIGYWQSNLIFFHQSWQCLKHAHYFLSHTPKKQSKLAGSKWPRQCVIGLFKREEQEVLVANTHFDFNPQVQKKSAGLVMDFLSEFPKDLPVVITGDFNCDPDSPVYEVFRFKGFGEVFENQDITTFHEFKGRVTGKHLDWILFRGGLVPVFRQVVKDSSLNRFPSDHYPVQARFEWSNISGNNSRGNKI